MLSPTTNVVKVWQWVPYVLVLNEVIKTSVTVSPSFWQHLRSDSVSNVFSIDDSDIYYMTAAPTAVNGQGGMMVVIIPRQFDIPSSFVHAAVLAIGA